MSLDNAIDTYEQASSEDVRGFMEEFVDFMDNQQQRIVNFYSGNTEELDRGIIENLEDLIKRCNDLINSLNIFSEKLETAEMWELLNFLEDIETRLQQTRVMPKLLRSSVTITGNKSGFYRDIVIAEGETIESTLRSLQIEGADDRWQDVAIQNNITEEDYGDDAVKAKVRVAGGEATDINDVVDVMDGKSIYGKDLDDELVFENEDLKALSPDKTMSQSVENLVRLNRGSVPEFPNYGIKFSDLIGGTIVKFSYPALVRQLTEVFSQDDTISSISIEDIEFVKQSLLLKFNVFTRLGENVQNEIRI